MSEAGSYRSIFRPGLFAGQVHIVTGGGTGIGRCTAHELASLGATVVLVGRKEDRLAATAAEIAEDGGTASHAVCDIRDEDAVRTLVSGIVARHGRIHGLVNNAGRQFPAPLMAIPKKGFDAVVATNLTGGFLMMREVFTQSMRAHGGAIVNMAADMWNGMPGMGHSGAARAGMVNLTKTAAFEWGFAGVRVNAVAPGWIASSGMDRYEGPVKALIPKLKDHVPLRRLGTEAEVSAAICFLLSEGAAFINGTTIQIDGGAPLGNPLFDMGTSPPSPEFNGFHRAAKPKVLDSKDES
ncbi:short-chain dehydrogenase/reductase SDR [Rhodomicrobium vannielii ATCC 17100]|uniref:Peroxisomal trans-2-enoyl-CoA reductase n=1 Tax=Rhodomicrobium vannielii (strain ATCC 17100 / DSM 162 / LMG 4299 / NCIMB 10020 / ATH 3.1.1) TaxID=648757 RepID=E3HYU3_RHOVT|nr:SDR family oxidoreductase [Rhodomicrobium vannielii]ADP69834.1 short-chain dehydrogenase/reductase SDR [Rhodomicrobium vannielii ATCC 17100]